MKLGIGGGGGPVRGGISTRGIGGGVGPFSVGLSGRSVGRSTASVFQWVLALSLLLLVVAWPFLAVQAALESAGLERHGLPSRILAWTAEIIYLGVLAAVAARRGGWLPGRASEAAKVQSHEHAEIAHELQGSLRTLMRHW